MSRPPSIASQSVVALAGDDLPPFLSFSVVRARLLSPISSKSAAGDNVTAEREGLLRIHGGQHGLSAVPCDTEWWRRERERERPHSLAGSLGSPPHAHHSAEKPPPPPNHRFLQQVASQVMPVQRRRPSPHLPSSRSETNPRRFQSPREANWFAKEGRGGRVPAPSGDRERGSSEVSRSSPPSPTTTNHHLRTTPVRAGPPGPRGRCISMTCDALPNGQGYCRWGRAPTSHLGDGEQKGGSDDVRR